MLRVEKGLLTHAELHGRTTLDDLGLGRMLKAGDCVGRALSQRPGLAGPEREQLVGLRPLAPGGRLVGGAHLVEAGAAFTAANDLGYLTSAAFSPALGHDIALGFLVDGRARAGARLRAVCALRGIDTGVEVVAPAFVDPDGEAGAWLSSRALVRSTGWACRSRRAAAGSRRCRRRGGRSSPLRPEGVRLGVGQWLVEGAGEVDVSDGFAGLVARGGGRSRGAGAAAARRPRWGGFRQGRCCGTRRRPSARGREGSSFWCRGPTRPARSPRPGRRCGRWRRGGRRAMADDLGRFVAAQDRVWADVLAELGAGRKRTHWMWFVFPQLAGLGSSPMAVLYAIGSLDEARAYLAHPLLGARLREATRLMLRHAGTPAEAVLGGIDAMKFRSSMTLFAEAAPDEPLFGEALGAFFGGPDTRTLALLGR